MKLITTMVSNNDADKLVTALVGQSLSVTRIGSTGGFLRHGNATLFIGVENEQVEAVLTIIREICRSRINLTPPPVSLTPASGIALTPIEVRVGGAVIFVQDVEHFERT